MTCTILLAVGFGVLLGLLAAMRLNTWKDAVITVFALITYATPLFWVGLMMIVVFSLKLGWLPTSGMENVAAFYEGWDRVKDIAVHLILPTITLSLFYLALYTRMMRASMLEQYGQDYVVTARAKGLTERRITFVHVLRNALLPVVTMAGVQVGALIGGSVIVESVFAWPGLGMLAFESLFARDLNLLLGIFMLSSILVIVVNLIVDIIYCFLDPRIEVSDMPTFWQRYKRNKSAVFGLGVILIVIIMAVTANFLYPFDPFRLAGKPLSGPGMNGFLLGSDSLGTGCRRRHSAWCQDESADWPDCNTCCSFHRHRFWCLFWILWWSS